MIEKITGILNEIDTEELRELQEIIDNTLETRKKNKERKKMERSCRSNDKL